jgi:hypothetical protein
MNQTIEERMQNVEDELKQLRKEMEESIARYNRPIVPLTDLEIKSHFAERRRNEN